MLAAELVVNTFLDVVNDDDGVISLREAIASANSTDETDRITFDPTVFSQPVNVIRLVQGQLEVTEPITIENTAGNSVVITGDVNGNDIVVDSITDVMASSATDNDLLADNTRVLNTTADTTLIGITITGGRVANGTIGGGGIYSAGDLMLIDAVISGNSTTRREIEGGGIFSQSGSVTLDHSTVSDNVTTGLRANGGGIYAFVGSVTLNHSTVSGNQTIGARAEGGGIATRYSSVTLNDSTVSYNRTTGHNAGGGGIFTRSDAVILNNSLVSDNDTFGSDSNGGGIFLRFGSITLNNSTVSGNTAGSLGGGIGFDVGVSGSSPQSLSIFNSIIAGNASSGFAPDFLAPINSAENLHVRSSLIGDSLGTTLDETQQIDSDGNLIGSSIGMGIIDPLLSPLQDNGGPTMTRALLRGSPAINAGAADAATRQADASDFDQRGVGFARVFNGRIDIGSFEFQAEGLLASLPNPSVHQSNPSSNSAPQSLDLSSVVVFPVQDAEALAVTLSPEGGQLNVNQVESEDLTLVSGDDGSLVITGTAVAINSFFSSAASFQYVPPADAFGDDAAIIHFTLSNSDSTVTEPILIDIGETLGPIVNSGSDAIDPFDGITSLREAIHFANSRLGVDRIRFDEKVFTEGTNIIRLAEGELFITDEVVIENSTGAEIVITGDANGDDILTDAVTNVMASDEENLLGDNSRVFNIASETTLIGLIATGGRTEDRGGGIFSTANLMLINSAISGNSTMGNNAGGGGIYLSNGSLTLHRSEVDKNSTAGGADGGGIYVGAGLINLSDSVVSGNLTVGGGGQGGGIATRSGSVTLNQSAVRDNVASGGFSGGGGISTRSGSVTLNQSTVSGNNATGGNSDGGGIATYSGSITLNQSTVNNNVSSGDGGGIATPIGSVTLNSSTVSGNSTTRLPGGNGVFQRYGGGIFSQSGSVILNRSTVTGNESEGVGGGIGNRSRYRGGGGSQTLVIVNSIISGNLDDGTAPDFNVLTNATTNLQIRSSGSSNQDLWVKASQFDSRLVRSELPLNPFLLFVALAGPSC